MTSDKSSPPSASGSFTISNKKDARRNPFSIASQTSKLLKLPLNLSGAMTTFTVHKSLGRRTQKMKIKAKKLKRIAVCQVKNFTGAEAAAKPGSSLRIPKPYVNRQATKTVATAPVTFHQNQNTSTL